MKNKQELIRAEVMYGECAGVIGDLVHISMDSDKAVIRADDGMLIYADLNHVMIKSVEEKFIRKDKYVKKPDRVYFDNLQSIITQCYPKEEKSMIDSGLIKIDEVGRWYEDRDILEKIDYLYDSEEEEEIKIPYRAPYASVQVFIDNIEWFLEER